MSRPGSFAGHLAWCSTVVDGRPACYGTAGVGLPVLFLHGWALGHHTYKRALKRLVQMGCQVIAPALPGFSGTANLPEDDVNFPAYADWVAQFLQRLGCEEPVMVIGHSFGGAVAVQLAADHPRAVRQLVLVNSIGGATWRYHGQRILLMTERPLWDWGLRFPTDLWPITKAAWVASFVRDDLLRNVVLNPQGTWRAAMLARGADLADELERIRLSGLPVLALSGRDDQVVPRASFEALCEAL
ncbi:MAG TPA: alpha/beta fold hydrolase, partial [Acidimicrobiales bacterium]|nr:alpha/beta fold hydrolase [Acidimicrobiales bacterium]